MPITELNINNKNYQITCDPGEDKRLREIASKLDQEIRSLSVKFPKASESYLLLLQCITMQDQIDEFNKNNSDEAMSESINVIAEYIENLAQKLEYNYSEK